MISSVFKNSYKAIQLELKDKEFNLLKHLEQAIKDKEEAMRLHSSAGEFYKGKEVAFSKTYEMFFGVLLKQADGNIAPSYLQDKITEVAKELKKLLGQ